ncbi:MAG: lysophospholipid acyltransferase family protein [Nocardioidaceae bacterium]|nr:lysophospholipid acyltransferase family protein [Nocardioidaceae bacterium]
MRVPPRPVRLVLGPIVVALSWVLAVVALPLLALVAAVASYWLPGRLRGLRLLGFALVGLSLELFAIVAGLVLWVGSGFGARLHTERFQRMHYAVLRWVLVGVVRTARRLFVLTLETDGVSWSPLDDGVPGSTNAMIVLSRHAGPGDSLLLMETLMNRDHLRRPRTVLKDTMALDPVVDIWFHRLPSTFINPNPRDGDADASERGEATIAALARDIGTQDALLIFPEGGNYTPRRRRRAIDRLRRRGHDEYAERAEQMENVLPPRPGGVLAAIEAAPHADLVLVAHTGLEHITDAREAWRVLPDHKTLHLRWWFHSADEVPLGRHERIGWLFERWAEIDVWIEAQEQPEQPAATTR